MIQRRLFVVAFFRLNYITNSNNSFTSVFIQVTNAAKDTCGGASHKAGRADSNGRKGLSETGVVFSTCPHGYLIRAVDMVKGETYRHVHYLHDWAFRSGYKFICYDAVCKYWPFAQDVGRLIEELVTHITKMLPFLSRWHGKTHAWYCQVKILRMDFNLLAAVLTPFLKILYCGHWLVGVGLTTGNPQNKLTRRWRDMEALQSI